MLNVRPVANAIEWSHAKTIRTVVFIEEQACPPEEEWDGYDETSRHLLGWAEDTPAATARWRTVRYHDQPVAKLERFAILPAFRGRGYGRALVSATLADAKQAGFNTFVLNAQAHLEAFYASFGFHPVGDPFMEAGIPHIKMVKGDAAVPRG